MKRLVALTLAFIASFAFAQNPRTVDTLSDQTISGKKTFASGKLCVAGSTSGTVCIQPSATAGTNTLDVSTGVTLTALAALTSAADKIPYFTGSGTAGLLTLDTDTTLAANSDTALATQKAVKAYVATATTGFGTGDVVGPASATNNAWAIFDGTTGKLLKNGSVPATVASSGSASDLGSGTLACARTPALTGDVTTSAGSCATTLATSGVTAGSYTNANITVDAKGRVTSAATGSGGSGSADYSVAQGRCTLESGVAVSTSDQTGKTTLYWTPYKGANIGLYNGTGWDVIGFSETSIALGTLTSGKNYDVFAYNNSGTIALELSSAWTNDTTRADAIALQDGIYIKSGTATRRYLCTFRTTSTTTTEDSGGGSTSQAGGKRFVWNYYNRVRRPIKVIDTTDSWTYTNATWRVADGATAPSNCVEFVIGVAEEATVAQLLAVLTASGTGAGSTQSGIGLDSTTSPAGHIAGTYGGALNSQTADRADVPAAGYHYFSWLERATQSGTNTFYGDGGGGFQSGLSVWITN